MRPSDLKSIALLAGLFFIVIGLYLIIRPHTDIISDYLGGVAALGVGSVFGLVAIKGEHAIDDILDFLRDVFRWR